MEKDLTITLVQTQLHWHDAEANRRMLAQKLAAHKTPTDLIILPEMFTTGFSMAAPVLAEPMQGPTLTWLAQQANQQQAVITGSFIVKEEYQYYNRLVWMRPNGSYEFYNKRHLFRMADEHLTYSAGISKSIFTLKDWNICPLICYDLRFPVWSRNRGHEYDLLIYVANWPQKRSLAWRTLLQARAIENLAYVTGVNRVGQDGNNILYSGDSTLYKPSGEVIWQQANNEVITTITLNKAELEAYRQVFPAHLDADDFSII